MSGVQESGEGVTTLRMPKAQVTSSSPARSSSTPRSWPWNEVVASARSPDGRAFHSPTVQQLHGIGIVEFFEQDHRPTFIIDLTNHANFQPGPLHVVFANASLRASHAVQELLQADTNDPDHKPDFPRFKAWAISSGKRHPKLMGMSYRDAWTEIWDDIEPHFINAWNYGQAILKHDDQLFVTRNGFLEETFFDWSVVPLVGSDGSVVGIYNPAFDNTRRKVNERRLQTLRELGEKTSEARNVKGFWAQVLKALEYNPFDVPLALIYSVSEDSDSEVSSMHSGSVSNPPQVILEGSLGIGRDHPTAVPSIDLRTSDAGFAPYMRESMAHSDSPVVLSKDEGTLPGHLIEGLKWRGFGDPCRTIVVFPVHPTTVGDSVVGFIVLGVNPRLQYNEDYQLFVKLVTRQLATSMASVVLFEEEIKRGQRAAQLAALDRQELSLQLRLRTQEAVESEYRFSRMAAFGPVGMFITDGLGKITYCNDMWWKISGHERKASTIDSWMQSIRDEDRLGVEAAWRKLVNDKVAVTHEFRFRGSRQVIDGNSVETWVLMSAYPEKNDGGDLKSIFGCLTDISQQKWAEDFQKQRREEAVEMKRQQENFIDITSHEMRNPLSAILQCADEIAASIGQYLSSDSAPAQSSTLHGLLDGCAEAASTITLCASHQKRIVDDILTLSKLDSQLLLVTPVDVQPVEVVRNVLRMFDSELNSGNIDIAFDVDPVYNELEVDWVKLDPSRMRQVLINLLTNAIKFTQGRLQRSIIVRLGASKHNSILPPSYFPSRQTADKDLTDKNGWGDGDKLNIHVSVTDTGPGLDDDEKKILFQRFSQTTPRTHVQYGGSGLGLFICRMLTELQGGQIGVESKKGVGSSFAFYIKARKVANPDPDPRGIVPTPRSSPAKIQPVPGPIDNVPRRIPAVISSRETRDAAVLAPRDLAQLPQTRCTKPDAAPAQQFDVLIVEDNLVNQKVLQRQLKIWGNNTHVANHGGEALEALSRSRFWSREMSPISITSAPPPAPTIEPSSSVAAETGRSTINISVILMDLEMPVMDGMTCARKIRELEAEGTIVRHIPIIAVTAYARPEQIESAKAAGIDDVISKPFRIPDLLPKIKELVNKYNTNTITFSTPYSVADVEEIE
ncbi:hypothetical protein P8C59_008046 [Phyllachora maydis]|uniref:Uncharacterized protein n=1 Tax=Phyllachora maydis TaxID=1825666 RepID=A0AAD9IBF9_9PEZI|nr:hypothetical protein P8C59_008046 [Phyllachora maydis]